MPSYWRVCVWVPEQRDPSRNGHPLYVWPRQGAGRVDDPDGLRPVLYLSDDPAGACAERFGDYARWTPAVLLPPPGAPEGAVLALVELGGDPDVLDLDDPGVLLDRGLRPSTVVSRERRVTQSWGRVIRDGGRHDGVSWWSYRDPRWASSGLWDWSRLEVAGEPEPLTLRADPVLEAAATISRVVERR